MFKKISKIHTSSLHHLWLRGRVPSPGPRSGAVWRLWKRGGGGGNSRLKSAVWSFWEACKAPRGVFGAFDDISATHHKRVKGFLRSKKSADGTKEFCGRSWESIPLTWRRASGRDKKLRAWSQLKQGVSLIDKISKKNKNSG